MVSAQNLTSRCRNCREPFLKKKGKRFCSQDCRVAFHNAGNTPTKAMEARIKKIIQSGILKGTIREEVARQLKALQRANTGKPLPVEIPEESLPQNINDTRRTQSALLEMAERMEECGR